MTLMFGFVLSASILFAGVVSLGPIHGNYLASEAYLAVEQKHKDFSGHQHTRELLQKLLKFKKKKIKKFVYPKPDITYLQ